MTQMFDDLLEDILPDHKPGFNLGDWLLEGAALLVAIYTAFRSYDFIITTLPEGWGMVAYLGLLAVDGGFLLWAHAIAKYVENSIQAFIAWSMFILSLIVMLIINLTDAFFYTSPSETSQAIAEAVAGASIWVFTILVILFGVAAKVFQLNSNHARLSRMARMKMGELQHLKVMGALQARLEQEKAAVTNQIVRIRAELAETKRALALKVQELEEMEERLRAERLSRLALSNGHDKEEAAAVLAGRHAAASGQSPLRHYTPDTDEYDGLEER